MGIEEISEKWNEPVFPGSNSLLQESYFIKVNDKNQAIWLKFTVLQGHQQKEFEVWGLVFPEKGRPFGLKVNVPEEETVVRPGELRFGDCLLKQQGGNLHCSGRIKENKTSMEWDFSLSGSESLRLFPLDFMYTSSFPKRKLVSPFFDAKAKGSLHFSGPGKKFSMKFKDASGMQGHNWGSEHSHRYVWAHCNTLRDEKNSGIPAVFEGFSGKIKVGPFITPHLTGLFLKPDAEFAAQYGISCFDLLAVNRYLNKTVSVDESNMTWDWTADYNPIRIAGKFKADRGNTAGLKYFDPDGKLHYCYNSKKAECSISLIHRKSNIVLREYHSSSCALEFLTDLEFKEMILF